MTLLLQILFLMSILLSYTVQRRNEKVKQKIKVDPISRLPEHISKELICVGCYGLNTELLKKLRGKKREFEIFDALKDICEIKFTGYCNSNN